eukprot:764580-Hanusia_phi.AAC.2
MISRGSTVGLHSHCQASRNQLGLSELSIASTRFGRRIPVSWRSHGSSAEDHDPASGRHEGGRGGGDKLEPAAPTEPIIAWLEVRALHGVHHDVQTLLPHSVSPRRSVKEGGATWQLFNFMHSPTFMGSGVKLSQTHTLLLQT